MRAHVANDTGHNLRARRTLPATFTHLPMRKRDELGQMLLTLGLLLQDRQRCPHGDGKEEGAAAKMKGRQRLTIKLRSTPDAVTSAPAAPSALPPV